MTAILTPKEAAALGLSRPIRTPARTHPQPSTVLAEPVVIALEGEPIGKGRARTGMTTRGQRVAYTPPRTRAYENALRQVAALVMRHRPPVDGPIAVEVEAVFPIPASWPKAKQAEAEAGRVKPTGKPDADNVLKVCDALNGVVWFDDAQVVEARIVKRYARLPGLTITVRAAA
jgi:Holliday junction resolvase RusA-like endonuclease